MADIRAAIAPSRGGFTPGRIGGMIGAMPDRPTKISFGEMRDNSVRGLLIYCADYRCSHYITISGDRWPDDIRLSDLEPKFICSACGKRGADVRPDFNWDKPGALTKGS
jgi:hypothetical protein